VGRAGERERLRHGGVEDGVGRDELVVAVGDLVAVEVAVAVAAAPASAERNAEAARGEVVVDAERGRVRRAPEEAAVVAEAGADLPPVRVAAEDGALLQRLDDLAVTRLEELVAEREAEPVHRPPKRAERGLGLDAARVDPRAGEVAVDELPVR